MNDNKHANERTNDEITYPNPDETNPAAGDRLNVGEAPVAVGSDNRRDELGDAERAHESERRTLHEEEAVRTGDEDESLRDDSDLQVHDRVQLAIVVVASSGDGTVGEGGTKRAVEPIGLDSNSNEGNPRRYLHVRRESILVRI